MFESLKNVDPEFWSSLPVLVTVALIGACWGSFLNVCIYRIPAELSVAFPGSRCPACKAAIRWYDNLPVLSYLILGGKCRNCSAKFSVRYAVVEALTAVLFTAIWLRFGPTWVTPVYCLMVFGLLLGSFVDLDEMWIPDRVTWGGILIGIPLSGLVPELHGAATALDGLQASAIGAAVGFFLLWSVGMLGTWAFKKDAMGFGDVKLLGAIGAFLGWQAVLFTVFASALVGSVVGVTLILLRKQELGGRLPFGPYLALGALTWVFGGDRLWDLYWGWMVLTP